MDAIQHRPRSIEILLVEDNPADARLTIELLAEGKVLNQVHVVHDGVEAMHYLRREAPFEDAVRPDVVLLDLNLPRMNGREVLEALKADADLKSIPVIVLTTSDVESDIAHAYFNQAAAFITKPVDLDRFVDIVNCIESFWFSIVTLPPKPGGD